MPLTVAAIRINRYGYRAPWEFSFSKTICASCRELIKRHKAVTVVGIFRTSMRRSARSALLPINGQSSAWRGTSDMCQPATSHMLADQPTAAVGSSQVQIGEIKV